MSIPGATTTITVSSPDAAEPYEPVTHTPVVWGVRAVIGRPTGREAVATGAAEVIDAMLTCDLVALTHGQQVTDDVTGVVYAVEWVMARRGLGLDHTTAGLRRVVR